MPSRVLGRPRRHRRSRRPIEVTVRAVGKTFERSRAYTERIAHPIDVDIRDAGDGNAGAMVRVNVPDMDAASLRVLGSTRTAGGRVKLVVGTKQARRQHGWSRFRISIGSVDVRLKVLFNLMNNKKIEVGVRSDFARRCRWLNRCVVGLDIERARDRRSGASAAGRCSTAVEPETHRRSSGRSGRERTGPKRR